jgi:riboflavin kinase
MSTQRNGFPYCTEGTVVLGFGRGGKELGIPTANFEEDVVRRLPDNFECGVYYGWAKISDDENIYKMVQSVGWNPYYKNTLKTMETHLIHKFDQDFYGRQLKVIVLGYIRPMSDFKSLDALIDAIRSDISVASQHLDEPASLKYKNDPFFSLPLEAAVPVNVSLPSLQCDNHLHEDHTQNSLLPSVQHDSSHVNGSIVKCSTENTNIYTNGHDLTNGHAKNESFSSKDRQEFYHPKNGKSSVVLGKSCLCQESKVLVNGSSRAGNDV